MSSKTLARAGASLVNRLLVSNPLKERSAAIALLQISSNPYSLHSLLQKLQIDRITPPPLQVSPPVGGDAETLRRIASPDGVFFPCGLPYLRFFIGEGDDALSNDPLLLLPRRTYQPSHIKRKRTHGYLAQSLSIPASLPTHFIKATKGACKVIKRRIAKGRARITV